MAAGRGGRARGGRAGGGRPKGAAADGFVASLRTALADALDVDVDTVDVRVVVDGEPVTGRVVTSVAVAAAAVPAAARFDRDERDEDDDERDTAEDRGQQRGASGATRPARGGRDRDEDESGQEAAPVTPEELDEEAEAAADLLEGLLDAMDLPGDLRIQVHAAHAEVEIVGAGEGILIGRRGQTLEAVQDLVRTAMQRRFERRSRVLVDVDGYRARRVEKLLERADEAIQEVLATGEPQRLEPMDAIERRLVHQRVAEHGGVVSHSHGREPARRIEIQLADD